ncbi:MAG: hypothetical protein ABFD52_05500 [Acidobacteriota bacterium]
MTEKKENDYPPFPNVFFEDEELFTPIQLRKYGYRIKREPGLGYRLYSLAEITKLIAEGKIVKITPKSTRPDLYEPGDELQAQLTLYRTAKQNRYVRTTLKQYTITISWDKERNRPRLALIPLVARKDGKAR